MNCTLLTQVLSTHLTADNPLEIIHAPICRPRSEVLSARLSLKLAAQA